MYYNKITGRIVFDVLDYFLISSFITSSFTLYLKKYLSEKASMARLKADIIKKSKLSKPVQFSENLSFKESKIKKFTGLL